MKFYDVFKWITFGWMIISLVIILFHEKELFALWIFGLFMEAGPRLEEGMDRVYCGQKVAEYNKLVWDAVAFTLYSFAVFISIFIYQAE